MDKINLNLVLLIIVILLIAIDILRNHKVFKSKKMLFAGILSYLMIIAFFFTYIYYPSGKILQITFIAIGSIPYGYFWYHRTTKSDKKYEVLLTGILILAVIIYLLTKVF